MFNPAVPFDTGDRSVPRGLFSIQAMAVLATAAGTGVSVSGGSLRVKELALEVFTGLDFSVRGVQFQNGCLACLLSKHMLVSRADAD